MSKIGYLENVVVERAEDLKNNRSYYPDNDQLLKVINDSPRLPPEDADLFHCHVARLLLCVTFLYTRVKPPNRTRLYKTLKSY